MAGEGGSTDVFDIQKFKAGLVEEVKKRPALYDASNASYKDHKKLEDLWNDVVDVLDPDCKHDLSVEFAKKHWKALRDDFFRRDKKLYWGEVTREKAKRWPMFSALEFLRPHSKRTERNRASAGEADLMKRIVDGSPVNEMLQPVKNEGTEEQADTNTSPKTGAAKRKASIKAQARSNRKRGRTVDNSDLSPFVNLPVGESAVDGHSNNGFTDHDYTLDKKGGDIAANHNNNTVPYGKGTQENDASTSTKDKQPIDAEAHFAESVAGTLRRFSPIVRAAAKSRIQQLLYELEFGVEPVARLQIQTAQSPPGTSTIVSEQSND